MDLLRHLNNTSKSSHTRTPQASRCLEGVCRGRGGRETVLSARLNSFGRSWELWQGCSTIWLACKPLILLPPSSAPSFVLARVTMTGFPHALRVTGPDHSSSEHSGHPRLPMSIQKCFMSQSLARVHSGVGRGLASDAEILLVEPCHARQMGTSLCALDLQ